MSEQERTDERETKTEGAIKAGDGEYYFDLDELGGIDAGPDYSTAHGAVVEGDRVLVGLMSMRGNSEAGMHSHPNEQFLYVLQGTFWSEIEGEEDVVFFTVKDLSHGIAGTPVDDAVDSAFHASDDE